MRKELYICHTPYHLLIAMVKALLSERDSDLILCASDYIGDAVIQRVRQSGIFERIENFPNLDKKAKELDFSVPVLKRRRALQGQLDEWVGREKTEHGEIYIFNDSSVWGRWLNSHKISYHLLEDGLNCFRFPTFLTYATPGNPLKRAIKRRMGIDFANFGQSRFTKSIEVNDKNGILLSSAKVVEVPRKDLYACLSPEDKKRILDAFLSVAEQERILAYAEGDVMLLITQPLSEDGYTTEEGKLELYRELVTQYGTDTVLIKTHPREKTDYGDLGKNCITLQLDNVPLEVLTFLEGLKIKRAVTTFSTAIEALDFCEERISLGLEETKKRLKKYE